MHSSTQTRDSRLSSPHFVALAVRPGFATQAASILLALTILLTTACGSDSADAPASGDQPASGGLSDFGFETSVIANAGGSYSVDDVEAAGWKRSRELPNDQLEGVDEVWFGFFQQKNLEVWVYGSHDAALSLGSPLAQEIVAQTRGVSGGGAGPYMKQTTHFAGYGVIGNLLVLCEHDVEVCSDLADALES